MIATVNGVDLFYETVGQGRPIIFMHGGLGLDHAYFRPWLDPLADHYQFIFFDTSGNGRSPRPNGFEGVSHETWVEEADALRAHLGLERIILFGHSYGSFLSMEYAIRHADRLDGLILADAAPALDYPEIVVGNAQKRGTPEQVTTVIEALTSPADSDGAFRKIWNTIAPIYYHHYDRSSYPLQRGRVQPRLRGLCTALQRRIAARRNPDQDPDSDWSRRLDHPAGTG